MYLCANVMKIFTALNRFGVPTLKPIVSAIKFNDKRNNIIYDKN